MAEFDNKIIRNIHVSRYIASWYNSGGTNRRYVNRDALGDPTKRFYENDFSDWLRSLVIDGKHLTEEEVRVIDYFRENGKLELEISAKQFLVNK